ncbi:hypothetical protein FOZ61_006153 [Perkinsus olseni]|uniref:Uncharacterized protein n=1 Tax=Perkinsus olseni TaxID=32597 RepID=A0A7J6LEJ3_PEROL|nr:hypothetical protein FOZ61_006153 [Perkinsus olseni]KAF4666295.1 hypothetical protein FOL46_003147 [Perkinsus olseni]
MSRSSPFLVALLATVVVLVEGQLSFLLPRRNISFAQYRTPLWERHDEAVVELTFKSVQGEDHVKMKVTVPTSEVTSPDVLFGLDPTTKRVEFINLTDDQKAEMNFFLRVLRDLGLIREAELSQIKLRYHRRPNLFSVCLGDGEKVFAASVRH